MSIDPTLAPSALKDTSSIRPRSTERTLWWVAFSVLTLSILVMLGAWN